MGCLIVQIVIVFINDDLFPNHRGYITCCVSTNQRPVLYLMTNERQSSIMRPMIESTRLIVSSNLLKAILRILRSISTTQYTSIARVIVQSLDLDPS